ncbi:homogentisate 1,2-dioxygenase [bacterium (Candidatus Blackallbacteria) CG17_big_fil_post_rev_8_21_14_2_50_48_46]|uniref:Homogentisate 1,2-dioxygenase n=1 Tax=bacterium (Candidatus Blackallbacteria) CG17_big_fil_post_rev_8_21_14_2_50_48_46 TaxID=2014261 RepID=A0A2M7FYD4_9BACT|nr:MAG: homogentisate 1,2-dioxygenase [bacterium (Candidatus Blackallbacteria) CG18_big_fil_WC_8_21_14_2_50_49_26]PIW14321.1 MAG: homogentisate 1,2-dioxygenase [bacterium (Candidatus Blackallbacteria) CG17_big_fil_post_rev_8_21_14_2_50_48_46]PIW45590.1 MAG: homogentisate 1,2-dioxygenase [bacterium (Candidatus Blackallbacteria) CG13_big_fil_rev_8_21_14_2_50_49_14]
MPFYIQRGEIPPKRHIAFAKPNGELYREELFSTQGFSNIYSNKYHHHMPTKVLRDEKLSLNHGQTWVDPLLQNYKAHSWRLKGGGNFYSARQKLLFNRDCALYTAQVTEPCTEFYRNAYADEVIFVHEGQGTLFSEYGKLQVKRWDYVVIPRGTTYQLEFEQPGPVHLFVIETYGMVGVPRHYRNEAGQLLETAPYCERDIQRPAFTEPIVEKGAFPVVVKYGEHYQRSFLEWHPFDLVGWDGAVYPWTINIQEFAPLVGKIHLPPSVHLLLSTPQLVICNFVPRLYDFHPQSIPAPYYHSNVDSDEVLYYVEGNFMSRTGIEPGSLTFHRKGLPHGPQPGKTEASIGQKETYEYAVMVDTFAPLEMTEHFRQCREEDYNQSWLEPSTTEE